MILAYLLLLTGLTISAVAIYYSVVGLTAIFSAAAIPIIIMGSALEVGKLVCASWLKANWTRAPAYMKYYMISAVAILMLITSMGIFGFLSKAHNDQNLVSGDVQSKIAIYDEKIKISRDNIDANRKALKQMDEAVDQVMGRSQDEKGADKAVAIRRGQQKERARILVDIEAEQKKITSLNEERAPLAAEFRKVESEVGPIKYIAALIYGDNPDSNVLEKAVRLVIIMIVLVFDPLALTLILAANKQFQWAREGTGGFIHDEPRYEPDDGPLTEDQVDQLDKSAQAFRADPHPSGWMFEKFPYLTAGKDMFFKDTPPMVAQSNDDQAAMNIVADPPGVEIRPFTPEEIAALESADPEEEFDEDDDELKAAIKKWKAANPEDTLKNQRFKLIRGEIAELPWMGLLADNELRKEIKSGFGTQFPSHAERGDTFVRVDRLPSMVYKYNGKDWMEVDKNLTDSYTYDIAYIDHLIEHIASGEYDAELLSETEREQVTQRLQSNTNT